MEQPEDFDPVEFKEIARSLPEHCFEEAYVKAFMLSTNEKADPFEVLRFKLLEEVANEIYAYSEEHRHLRVMGEQILLI